MKKNLIYWIAFGNYYYREMVSMSILSVLEQSNFDGDIVVLSDSEGIPQEFISGRVKVIDLTKFIPEIHNLELGRFSIFCLKACLHKVIDINKYGFCLYLDGDVLVNYKNMNSLLNFWADCGRLQLSGNEGWNIERNVPSTGSQVLTSEEKERWGKIGFCAGVVGFPGGEFGKRFLNDWWEYNLAGNLEKDDQGNLTALVMRKYIHDYEYITFLNLNRWRMDNITHYHSKNKQHFWEHVKFILHKYEIQQDKHIGSWEMYKPCEGLRNIWKFTSNMVFINDPQITGTCQHTKFATYIWWNLFEGFEKVIFTKDDIISGSSFRGGDNSFTLKRIKDH